MIATRFQCSVRVGCPLSSYCATMSGIESNMPKPKTTRDERRVNLLVSQQHWLTVEVYVEHVHS